MTRIRLLGVVFVLAIGVTACQIPGPLTYPLLLTPPVDASGEVLPLLGQPPAPAQSPVEVAQRLAASLTKQHEGCEVLTIAQVIWVAPSDPAFAAVEVRGLCDDSVAGVWYEVTIRSDPGLGWVAVSATKQDICSRGVSGTVCV